MQIDEELKQTIIEEYLAANPTPETSAEIIKEIAENFDVSPNGVQLALVSAKVFVKKEQPVGKKTEASTGTKRVSKDAAINDLRAAIVAKGAEVDEEILGKLTGKAAVYFKTVIAG